MHIWAVSDPATLTAYHLCIPLFISLTSLSVLHAVRTVTQVRFRLRSYGYTIPNTSQCYDSKNWIKSDHFSLEMFLKPSYSNFTWLTNVFTREVKKASYTKLITTRLSRIHSELSNEIRINYHDQLFVRTSPCALALNSYISDANVSQNTLLP